jgi:hypothetical protein
MTILTFEVRMEGIPEGCKEVAAMELEDILRKIGRATVKCTGAREIREEQLSMEMRRRA